MKSEIDELFAAREQEQREIAEAKERKAQAEIQRRQLGAQIFQQHLTPVLNDTVTELNARNEKAKVSTDYAAVLPTASLTVLISMGRRANYQESTLKFQMLMNGYVQATYVVWGSKGKVESFEPNAPMISSAEISHEWCKKAVVEFLATVLKQI
ncbi:MAG: hypothetical protein ACLGID_18350 [Gammaproteobacteria bacterium]